MVIAAINIGSNRRLGALIFLLSIQLVASSKDMSCMQKGPGRWRILIICFLNFSRHPWFPTIYDYQSKPLEDIQSDPECLMGYMISNWWYKDWKLIPGLYTADYHNAFYLHAWSRNYNVWQPSCWSKHQGIQDRVYRIFSFSVSYNYHNSVRQAKLREADWLQVTQWAFMLESRHQFGTPQC